MVVCKKLAKKNAGHPHTSLSVILEKEEGGGGE